MKLYYRIKNRIRSYLFKPSEPPSYEMKRAILLEHKNEFGLNVLVETGTFLGDTVEYFKHSFDRIVSIELAVDLASRAMRRFEQDKHVTIVQGDSGRVLTDILKQATEPILFWLDGHYSSEFYIGSEYIRTARADLDTPIAEELKSILSDPLKHVILIDDARCFTGAQDYPSLHEVKRLVKNATGNYTVNVQSDIIRILPL